ncbi:MAG: family 43 glycosylhydrolase [Paraprevotella sp.]|nr:family 43 glycosylhydrolase [Paraprevotella sp.]
MKKLFVLLISLLSVSLYSPAQSTGFRPGEVWNDTDSHPINAHGGCVVYHDGTYYWFGEDRTKFESNGVSCYASADLYNWKRIGLALKADGEPREDLNDISKGRLFERPKVVYNPKTRKWVMWSHWEKSSNDYSAARVCVVVSDQITGPYTLYKTFRPNGHDSRDQTLFVDSDGKAYHICSTDMNTNTNVAALRDDFLEPESTEQTVLKGQKCEAATVFKWQNRYYGLFSDCTGWNPNPGRRTYTIGLLGEWTRNGNFATDPLKQLSYRSQPCYVFPVEGKKDAFIYMGDRWNSNDVEHSTHVWLPISMRSGYPVVRWYDQWDLSIFDKMYRYKPADEIRPDQAYALLEQQADRLVSKPANGFTIADDNDDINLNFVFVKTEAPDVYKLKEVKSQKFLTNVFGSLRLSDEEKEQNQKWKFIRQPDGFYRIQSIQDRKFISVSENSTFNGTPIYLTDSGEPHYFGVYFDSDRYSDGKS